MSWMFCLYLLIGLVGLLFIFMLLAALTSKSDFEGEMEKVVAGTQDQVWELLNDIEGLPERRKEVKSVEMLEPTSNGRLRWKEKADMGGTMSFEMLKNTPKTFMAVKMTESSFGMSGTWSYTLEPQGETTKVSIHEKSKCAKLFVRMMMTFAGRNANIKREFKVLEKALKNATPAA